MPLPNIHKAAIVLIALAVISIGACIYSLGAAHKEIAEITDNIARMRIEHQLAITAANEALLARDEVLRLMGDKKDAAEQALIQCPDFSGLAIPPDVLRLLKEHCSKPNMDATRGTTYGY